MKNLISDFKAQTYCLLVSFLFLSAPLFAQQWEYAGQYGLSETSASGTIVTDHNGTPYIAYDDYHANVRKYNGSSWVSVGDTSFSSDVASYVSLAFNNSNTPYVVFEDWANGNKATVMSFNGTSWVLVGSAGFSDSAVISTSIAIDNSGTIYVAYQNNNGGGTIAVMKYTGGAWVQVGALLPPSYFISNLAIDGSGTPYVAYVDIYNGFGFMKKFDGTNWINLGPYVVPYVMNYPSIAIDQQGTPYIAFQDDGGNATVFKFQNSTWDTLGYAEFNYSCCYSGAKYTSLTIASNDSIYLAFQDGDPLNGGPGKAVAAKYTGSGWSPIGTVDFTIGQADGIQIAIDGSGTPYVAFADQFYNGKLSVMKYGTPTGVAEIQETERLQIVPNPAQGYLQITVPKAPDGKLTLMDMTGKIISAIQTDGKEMQTLNIENLSAGVYVLLYQDSLVSISKKVVKN